MKIEHENGVGSVAIMFSEVCTFLEVIHVHVNALFQICKATDERTY